MSNIYRLVNDFVSMVEKTSEEPLQNIKLAGRENRKMIEKKLQNAKQVYDQRRLSLQGKRKTYEDMASIIDRETTDMNQARDYMRKAYDVLKNMDLVDSNEVRIFPNNDEVGYVKNRRIFRLKIDDEGNVELEPFKKKNLSKDDPDMDMVDEDYADDSAEEDLLNADELLSSLIDSDS